MNRPSDAEAVATLRQVRQIPARVAHFLSSQNVAMDNHTARVTVSVVVEVELNSIVRNKPLRAEHEVHGLQDAVKAAVLKLKEPILATLRSDEAVAPIVKNVDVSIQRTSNWDSAFIPKPPREPAHITEARDLKTARLIESRWNKIVKSFREYAETDTVCGVTRDELLSHRLCGQVTVDYAFATKHVHPTTGELLLFE